MQIMRKKRWRKVSLVRIEGYFVTGSITSKNQRCTRNCIQDMHEQIKKKQIKLTLNHSDIEIGELVAYSIDKNGLQGGFVLYPDNPLYFKIICGIAFGVFKGLSTSRYDKSVKEKGKIEVTDKVELINVGLVKNPSNKDCMISNLSRDRAIDFLINESNKLALIELKGGG